MTTAQLLACMTPETLAMMLKDLSQAGQNVTLMAGDSDVSQELAEMEDVEIEISHILDACEV